MPFESTPLLLDTTPIPWLGPLEGQKQWEETHPMESKENRGR